jgi:predicted RecA/RadA family phage recombinase
MKNFVQPGEVLTIPAPAAVLSGGPVSAGVLFGVAQHAAASGVAVDIATRGVFELAKTSAQAWTVGAAIYYIPTTGLCTTATTAGNLLIGVAAAAAANPSATGLVRLNGSAPAAVT